MFSAKKSFVVLAALGALMLLATPAVADIDSFFDVFWIELGGSASNWNEINDGGGTGYEESGTQWFPYNADIADPSQTDPWGGVNPSPSWRNQWFYDGEYRPERYKVVDVAFTYALLDYQQNGGTDIVINWATPEWSLANPGSPPTGFNQNDFIGRAVVTETWLDAGDNGVYEFSGTFDLRDFGVNYNPEWVSIDVAGYNIQISSATHPGSFDHYCIPEPGTFVLLTMAGVSALIFVWRKRRTA